MTNSTTHPTKRILIVDDEEALRFFLADALTQFGWQVTEADSGEAALVALATAVSPFDVMLLDLRMTGIDGVTVMEEAKTNWPDLQVVIMTAYATVDSAVAAVRNNAFDYLRKPCSTNDLMDCVTRAWQQKQTITQTATAPLTPPAAPNKVHSGDLQIDLLTRKVQIGDQNVQLTPTEYELLALLAQTPGESVTLQTLIAKGLGYDPEDAQAQETLRVHVSRLRQKLPTHTIGTVRGGGYVFAATSTQMLSPTSPDN